jgi:putative transposase
MARRAPRSNAHPVHLTRSERKRLKDLTSRGFESARVLKRARILLLLADGWAPSDVPEAAGAGEATVRRTRRKYEEGGVENALYDRPRPGQPRVVSQAQEAAIIAMVCTEPPAGCARWTVRLIHEEALRRGIVASISREPIRLLLRDHDLKPWREKNVVRSHARH